ncbi:DUF805 domain-containing protein [Zoogloea sp.]|uniref:DUF805 domain-containing protein n=1 Tax=Zoogloea sp. TaxID=49181 RepID=UPI0031FE429E
MLPDFTTPGQEEHMFCPECGKETPASAKFCTHCGAKLQATGTAQQPGLIPLNAAEPMTFGQSIKTCLSKYADFKGRAGRPEYWWFFLFCLLLGWAGGIIDHSGTLTGFINLALLLPSLAAATRRLHDTGRSGWWQLLSLTVIGLIPLFYWLACRGNEEGERFEGRGG